jgi:hypothetical protein
MAAKKKISKSRKVKGSWGEALPAPKSQSVGFARTPIKSKTKVRIEGGAVGFVRPEVKRSWQKPSESSETIKGEYREVKPSRFKESVHKISSKVHEVSGGAYKVPAAIMKAQKQTIRGRHDVWADKTLEEYKRYKKIKKAQKASSVMKRDTPAGKLFTAVFGFGSNIKKKPSRRRSSKKKSD